MVPLGAVMLRLYSKFKPSPIDYFAISALRFVAFAAVQGHSVSIFTATTIFVVPTSLSRIV